MICRTLKNRKPVYETGVPVAGCGRAYSVAQWLQLRPPTQNVFCELQNCQPKTAVKGKMIFQDEGLSEIRWETFL